MMEGWMYCEAHSIWFDSSIGLQCYECTGKTYSSDILSNQDREIDLEMNKIKWTK